MRRRVVLSSFVLWALAVAAPAADLAEIQRRGTLRVLVVDGSPSFFAVRSGAAPGMERELLEGFAKRHGVKVEPIELASWDLLLPALAAGRGDVIAGGVTVTAAREKQVAFTSEVFPTRDVVLTRKPHRVVTTVAQLREERVGTIKGSSLAETVAAAQVPAKNVDDGIPATGILESLQSGRVTAFVDGVEDALLLRKQDPTLQIGTFVGPPASLAFGVRPQDKALHAALDAYVVNVRRSPMWSRLVVQYFGDTAVEVLKKTRADVPAR